MEASSNSEIEHLKKQNKLFHIKSKYILLEIFNYIFKIKLFKILKPNNSLKKRINIDIKDYKECSVLYSSIEIEVIPVADINDLFINIKKGKDKHVPFINIKKGEEKYYHIYFDNNITQEVKINYLREDDKVKVIKIKIDYQIKSFNNLFDNCKSKIL